MTGYINNYVRGTCSCECVYTGVTRVSELVCLSEYNIMSVQLVSQGQLQSLTICLACMSVCVV